MACHVHPFLRKPAHNNRNSEEMRDNKSGCIKNINTFEFDCVTPMIIYNANIK